MKNAWYLIKSIFLLLRRWLGDKLKLRKKNNQKLKKVELFIGGKAVDLSQDPEVFFNTSVDDLTNPTIVKNSYSATLVIEGTPNNNKLFGHFWNLERIQNGPNTNITTGFNASQKTPFTIYINGEIYESGYVKLESVKKTGEKIEYSITLFGGLGEFIYCLSYDEGGEQLKLSDLTYMENGDGDEFDFTINRQAIEDAWLNYGVVASPSHKWHYINFAPCYNGIPDDFSADKCLINFNNAAIWSSTTVDGITYTPSNGYGLGTLPEKMGEWSTRDLRSYLQRPIFRMKEVINACATYAQRYGYTVDLDSFFFNGDNPYWENTWFTLPMLNELTITGNGDESGTTHTATLSSKSTYNHYNATYLMSVSPSISIGTNRAELTFRPSVSATTYSLPYLDPIANDVLYTSTMFPGGKTYGGYAIQLLALDGSGLTSNVIGGSDVFWITSKRGEDYLRLTDTSYQPLFGGTNYTNSFGWFEPKGSGKYAWNKDITLSMDVPTKTVSFALNIVPHTNIENGWTRGRLFDNVTLSEYMPTGASINTVTVDHTAAELLSASTFTSYMSNDNAGYTGAKLTKQILLNTENTPADYLLSYCKLFGLYIWKHPKDKVIHISSRNTFYQTGVTQDLDELIDRSQPLDITPLTFDSKWYDMKLEGVEGNFYTKYLNTYGKNYGIQRIDTGYNFNADANDLFEGNVFKCAVEGLQQGKYMLAPAAFAPSNEMPYYVLQGFKYDLYNGTGSTTVDMSDVNYVAPKPLGNELYFDNTSKVQFEDADGKGIDGKNVLLFYRGMKEMVNSGNTQIPYYISDDMADMGRLNDGQPCWLYTESEYASGGTQIATKTYYLPDFGRYIINGLNGYLKHSLDFGQPRELFIPDAVSRETGTIYYNFWQRYIEDMYSINSRVLDCYCLVESNPNPEWLRKFYWFDNSIWRLNAITDWNICKTQPTLLQFVKVQDRENYTLSAVTESGAMSFTLSSSRLGPSGGTVTGTIIASSPWYIEYDQNLTLSKESGTGDDVITIDVPSTTGTTDTAYDVILMASESQVAKSIVREGIHISVVPSTNAFPAEGGTATLTITANVDWTITMDATVGGVQYPDFFVLSQSAGTGNAVVTVECPPTPSATTRQEYIYIIHNGRMYANTHIAQYGSGYFTLTPGEDFTVPADPGATVYTQYIDTDYEGWEVDFDDEIIYDSNLVLGQTYSAGQYTHTFKINPNPIGIQYRTYLLYKKGTTGLGGLWITQQT